MAASEKSIKIRRFYQLSIFMLVLLVAAVFFKQYEFSLWLSVLYILFLPFACIQILIFTRSYNQTSTNNRRRKIYGWAIGFVGVIVAVFGASAAENWFFR